MFDLLSWLKSVVPTESLVSSFYHMDASDLWWSAEFFLRVSEFLRVPTMMATSSLLPDPLTVTTEEPGGD